MWSRTVGCIVTLALALLAVPLAAAPPTGKVHRIGWLRHTSPSPALREALLHGLRDLGYVEGQNLVLEVRHGEGQAARLPALAAELVQLPVEVLVTSSNEETRVAKAATSTIPIVFAGVSDPVLLGFIASWARPGGNITGVAHGGVGWGEKGLELLKEMVPAATRIAMLRPVNNPGVRARGTTGLETAARLLGVDLHFLGVRDPATDLAGVFATLASERVDALHVSHDPSWNPYITRIVELVAERRLPAIYVLKSYVTAGGLMAYYTDSRAMVQRAGTMVGKILQGTKPADIPAEQPMKFELIINLKTAAALGLTIPPTLLFQADEVIR